MKIKSLKLEHFQGISDLSLNFGGKNAIIYGDNGTGKTTVSNAVEWLLFDKLSTGVSGFNPKTKDKNGKDKPYLNNSVEVIFELSEGRELKLKKVYKEIYKKKRGSTTEDFSGHETNYYIDGVPTKAKEYNDSLVNYFGKIEIMKMLMIPHYFSSNISWEDRRKILLEMCGDISDEDVINANIGLRDLPLYLKMPGTTDNYYTVEEYKKIADGKKKEINKDLQMIPARIDEAKKAIPLDAVVMDKPTLDRKVAEIRGLISRNEQSEQDILRGNGLEILQKQIYTLETENAGNRAKHAEMEAKNNEDVYKEIKVLKDEIYTKEKLLSSSKTSLSLSERELVNMNERREELTAKYFEIKEETWHGDEICPTCNRELQGEVIQNAIDAFSISKSDRLEEIQQTSRTFCSKDMVVGLKDKIEIFKNEVDIFTSNIYDLNLAIKEKEAQLTNITPFEETITYKTVLEKIQKLKEDSLNISEKSKELVIPINNEISDLNEQLNKLFAIQSNLSIISEQEMRIKELSTKEKDLSKEFEHIEHGIYLCEEFIKSKVSMLTDKINSKFETVRFRLFTEQINGGIKEDCEVMVNCESGLVPYTFANNASRINAGLEIIETLSKYYGMDKPVFIDNAESVTKLKQISSQVIQLVVSENDKILRLEIKDNEHSSSEF